MDDFVVKGVGSRIKAQLLGCKVVNNVASPNLAVTCVNIGACYGGFKLGSLVRAIADSKSEKMRALPHLFHPGKTAKLGKSDDSFDAENSATTGNNDTTNGENSSTEGGEK